MGPRERVGNMRLNHTKECMANNKNGQRWQRGLVTRFDSHGCDELCALREQRQRCTAYCHNSSEKGRGRQAAPAWGAFARASGSAFHILVARSIKRMPSR